jgi:YfiH family protein
VKLFRWDIAGPYRVAFSTRLGGVSEGPYSSLNLGIKTADETARVLENRRRLAAATGADAETACMAMQVHGADVAEATRGGILTTPRVWERCDGLWSDRPGQAMLLLTADCLPVALARLAGARRLAVLHVGWRGILAGILGAGVRALEGGETAAIVGPGIGRCCYEVGEEVAGPFRARFGDDVVDGRRLDLRLAVERGLVEAGCTSVDHVDRCTACERALFFSHRRDKGVTGRQGVLGYIA